MLLLIVAALNMAVFHLTAGKKVASWDRSAAAPRIGKITAALSIALWVGIIFSGRVIGFTTTGAQAKEAPPPAGNFDDFLNNPAASAPPAPAPAEAAPTH
jgi:hypothetical protein